MVDGVGTRPNEVIARGVTGTPLIARTQKLAADRLAELHQRRGTEARSSSVVMSVARVDPVIALRTE
jgi:hypothetical protein